MIVVADASVLVAELLRERGRALLSHAELQVVVAEEQWEEAEHELPRRVGKIVASGQLTGEQARLLHESVHALINHRMIEIIPRTFYLHRAAEARRRVPRDARDWAPVALALALDAGILTAGHDFLGCGCPAWTVQTLREHLDRG